MVSDSLSLVRTRIMIVTLSRPPLTIYFTLHNYVQVCQKQIQTVVPQVHTIARQVDISMRSLTLMIDCVDAPRGCGAHIAAPTQTVYHDHERQHV